MNHAEVERDHGTDVEFEEGKLLLCKYFVGTEGR